MSDAAVAVGISYGWGPDLRGGWHGAGDHRLCRNLVKSVLESGRLVKLFEDGDDFGYFTVTRLGVQRAVLKSFLRWLKTQWWHDVKYTSKTR